MHARALDRSRALDVFADRRARLATAVNDRNQARSAVRERLRETHLPHFGEEMATLEPGRDQVAEVLDALEGSFRENLADWDMSGGDAEKLMRAFAQNADVIRSEGSAGVGAQQERTPADLISV